MAIRKPRKPAPGDCVIVWWLDSGAGWTGAPRRISKGTGGLYVKETHGRVISCGERKDDSGIMQDTLALAMCSAGATDSRSEIAFVWWDSVVSIHNFGNVEA